MFLRGAFCFVLVFHSSLGAIDPETMARGEKIYLEKCSMCHQVTGTGVATVYPPLAGSEWFIRDRARVIKALCEGMSGPIEVAGKKFAGIMPAQVLDDGQVADVLTYAARSWGNEAAPFAAKDIAKVRAETQFKTYADLLQSTAFQPLPPPPDGWTVRTAAELPEFCTRLATSGDGAPVYALATTGNIYLLDRASGAVQPIIRAVDYLVNGTDDISALGFLCDAEERLWIVTNQRREDGDAFVQNEVIIYRTTSSENGHPANPKPWFKVRYPFGVGPYNHGVGHLDIGSDGMLYVNSGSRTDGGEEGNDTRFSKDGETDITACVWRLDPKADEPKIEVMARGIRNAFGFAWDGEGRLFTVSNGPDANAPEEMDFIEPGRHYGFPFQFSNWPVKSQFPYPHTPPPPNGIDFALPVENLGPAGGGSPAGLATFDAHSSPGGMIWCGEDFPEPLRHRFLITRFGNLLGPPATPKDVGFDVLSAKMNRRADGRWEARVETVLAPLGRPLDVVRTGPGHALLLEYTRPTNFRDRLGWLPGRMIELAPAPR
ncbi:MAG: c-type cytochrome [Chthoniobacteraceae bacterium]